MAGEDGPTACGMLSRREASGEHGDSTTIPMPTRGLRRATACHAADVAKDY